VIESCAQGLKLRLRFNIARNNLLILCFLNDLAVRDLIFGESKLLFSTIFCGNRLLNSQLETATWLQKMIAN
jgi:hypothetical protein